MKLTKRACGIALALSAVVISQGTTYAETIFAETFDNFDNIFNDPNDGDEKYYGLPLQGPNGSDEFWYGGRFEISDNGTINQDLAVQEIGGNGNYTPVGRFEDEAGLLFKIDQGYTDITLDFDWRTFSAGSQDRLVVGYYVGDLGFDTGANRMIDFHAQLGGQTQVVNWWNTQWTELVRGVGNSFTHESFALPDTDTDEIWVSFWLDNGEGDHGKIDNVVVEATLIPEPSSIVLIGFAALAISRCRRLFC